MTTQPIVESGMTFGPYPEGQCFYVEKSAAYADIQPLRDATVMNPTIPTAAACVPWPDCPVAEVSCVGCPRR